MRKQSSGRISCDLHRGVEGTGTECERGAYTDTSSTVSFPVGVHVFLGCI